MSGTARGHEGFGVRGLLEGLLHGVPGLTGEADDPEGAGHDVALDQFADKRSRLSRPGIACWVGDSCKTIEVVPTRYPCGGVKSAESLFQDALGS